MGQVISFSSREVDGDISWTEYQKALGNRDIEEKVALSYKKIVGAKERPIFVPHLLFARSSDQTPYGCVYFAPNTNDCIVTHENFPRSLHQRGVERTAAIQLAAAFAVGLAVFNRDIEFADRSDQKQVMSRELRDRPWVMARPQLWGKDAFLQYEDRTFHSIHTVSARAAATVAFAAVGNASPELTNVTYPIHIAALADPATDIDIRHAVSLGYSR